MHTTVRYVYVAIATRWCVPTVDSIGGTNPHVEIIERGNRVVFVGPVETFDHAVVVRNREVGDGHARFLSGQLRFRNDDTMCLHRRSRTNQDNTTCGNVYHI